MYQDRLVKEFKLRGIRDGANKWLGGGFVNRSNERFAKGAASAEDGHGFRSNLVLGVSKTTIQLENKYSQLERLKSYELHAKQKITVRRHLDESILLWSKGQQLDGKPVKQAAPRKVSWPKGINTSPPGLHTILIG